MMQMKPRVIPGNRKFASGIPQRLVRLEKEMVRVNPKPFPLKKTGTQLEMVAQKGNGMG